MSEQELQELEVEEPTVEDQVVDALNAMHPDRAEEPESEEPEVEEEDPVATTEPSEVEESPTPETPTQTDEEREIAEARRIRSILLANPELAEAVVSVERGDGVVIPRQVIEAARRFQQQPEQPEQPEEDFADKFYSDPVAFAQSVEERLARFEQAQTQAQQARMRAEAEQNSSFLVQTGEAWQAGHPELNDDHIQQIASTIAETGLIARNLKRNGGNREKAVRDALDAALRIEYPELAQQRQTDQIVREANRKRRAGATAASPRSAARTTEETKPRNRAERVEVMADAIRELNAAQQ